MKQVTNKTGAVGSDADVKDVAIEIMQYLEKNPRGKDTLEGIRVWWLENGAIPASRVEKALSWLIQHQLVAKETLPDGGVVFSLTRNESANNKIDN